MKSITTRSALLATCTCLMLSGCQAGKMNMGSLAWWQKEDTLGSKYIEPPSHQYTPSDSAVVSDDPDLPPLPPDIEKTVESFEEEVAKTYQELAREFGTSMDAIAKSQPEATVDAPKSLEPVAPNPLTPRSDEQIASKQDAGNDGSSSQIPYHADNGFGGFDPGSQGTTNYERLAQNSLAPAAGEPGDFAARPEATLPGAFMPDNNASSFQPPPTSSNGDLASSSGFSPSMPAPANGFSPQATPESANATAGEEVSYPSTPYEAFEPKQPVSTPAASSQTGGFESTGQSGFVPQSTPPAATASGDGGDFGGSNLPLQSGNNSSSLQIQGQGSYAPGSVRAPNPVEPADLVLPPASSGQ